MHIALDTVKYDGASELHLKPRTNDSPARSKGDRFLAIDGAAIFNPDESYP